MLCFHGNFTVFFFQKVNSIFRFLISRIIFFRQIVGHKCDGMSHQHPTEHRSCPTSEAAVASTSQIRVSHHHQQHQHVIEPSTSGACVLSDTDSGVADTASEDGRSASRASTSKKTSSTSDLQPLRDPSHYEELSVIGNGMYTRNILFFLSFQILISRKKSTYF